MNIIEEGHYLVQFAFIANRRKQLPFARTHVLTNTIFSLINFDYFVLCTKRDFIYCIERNNQFVAFHFNSHISCSVRNRNEFVYARRFHNGVHMRK